MYCPPERRPAASKGNILMAWTPWLSISPRMIRTGSLQSDVHGGARLRRPGRRALRGITPPAHG
jgi:hypothetical protein